MNELKELMRKIEELRKEMDDIISTKGDLLDSEIIDISRLLDEHLVEYYRVLKNRTL